jgi:hypothetical protein
MGRASNASHQGCRCLPTAEAVTMTAHSQFYFRSVRRAVVAFAVASTASCHGGSGNAEGAPDGAQATVSRSVGR